MKTIKVVDLLNKLVNGEEVPRKIKLEYAKTIWIFDEEDYDYHNGDSNEYYDDKLFFSGIENTKEFLNDKVEIIEENKKELHANNIEFNIYDDKKEVIITLDENDLGIDKLHLDNCYFYKENDKWYVKHINLKPIAYISQEHKIPEKFKVHSWGDKDKYGSYADSPFPTNEELMNKINEILDYLEVNNDRKGS